MKWTPAFFAHKLTDNNLVLVDITITKICPDLGSFEDSPVCHGSTNGGQTTARAVGVAAGILSNAEGLRQTQFGRETS